MIDRAKLEEAIGFAKKLKPPLYSEDKRECLTSFGLGVVIDAAEAHLATMPKPPRKVKITHWVVIDATTGTVQGALPSQRLASEHAAEWTKMWKTPACVVELTGDVELPA